MSGHDASRICMIGGRHADTAVTPDQVGAKAANLMRLNRLGLRVPPALALDTVLCREYHTRGALPDGFRARLAGAIRHLEDATGLALGGRRPLMVSVRSSPPASMPGMLETMLNVGLTEPGVSGLIRRTGNPWLAWDALRRLVLAFAETVHHVPQTVFDQATAAELARSGAASLQEIDALSLRALTRKHLDLLARAAGAALPAEPIAQIVTAVEAVLQSWRSPHAIAYRRLNGLDEDTGTGVLIQAMVFGNGGARSGSGVGFTRNPATGDQELYVDFLFNAQGEDVVSGKHPVTDVGLLPRVLPQVWADLQRASAALEGEFRDMQDFEFTVEDEQLFFLQTRSGKRTPWAALRIATDMVDAGVLDTATAVQRLSAYDLDAIVRSAVRPDADEVPIARATAAGIGVASGAVVFDAVRAQQVARDRSVILMRPEMSTADIAGVAAAAGVVTTFGGRTSHAAVVARQLGKVCLVGCEGLHINDNARECTIDGRRLHEGDQVTLDGETGLIYDGRVPVVSERPVREIALVKSWREAARMLACT